MLNFLSQISPCAQLHTLYRYHLYASMNDIIIYPTLGPCCACQTRVLYHCPPVKRIDSNVFKRNT